MIAKLEVPDQDALDELVVQRIQSIDAVDSTRTFIAIGGMHWDRRSDSALPRKSLVPAEDASRG